LAFGSSIDFFKSSSMFLTQSIDLSSAVNLPFAYALTAHKDPEEVLPPNMNCYTSIYANSRATCAPHLRRNRASNRPFTFSIEDFGSRVLQFAMHAADDRLNEALLDA
jgi:sulfur relay (sulfurtransferase) DsrF/TusC family protein